MFSLFRRTDRKPVPFRWAPALEFSSARVAATLISLSIR